MALLFLEVVVVVVVVVQPEVIVIQSVQRVGVIAANVQAIEQIIVVAADVQPSEQTKRIVLAVAHRAPCPDPAPPSFPKSAQWHHFACASAARSGMARAKHAATELASYRARPPSAWRACCR
jgi:hypothetical protein